MERAELDNELAERKQALAYFADRLKDPAIDAETRRGYQQMKRFLQGEIRRLRAEGASLPDRGDAVDEKADE